MSAVGLMDLRIDVYRIDDGSVNPTNSLGEPGPEEGAKPSIVQRYLKASIQMLGFTYSSDEGAGEHSGGHISLFTEKKANLKLGDIVHVTKGGMVDTWWEIEQIPFHPPRAKHQEARIYQYTGLKPDV